MLNKLLTPIVNKLEARRKKVKQKLELANQKQTVDYLIQGYQFLKWAEKQLPNRHAKKAFLRRLLQEGITENETVKYFATNLHMFQSRMNFMEQQKKDRYNPIKRIKAFIAQYKAKKLAQKKKTEKPLATDKEVKA